jgi:hypothetical protein
VITNFFENLKYTEIKSYRYIVPSKWLKEIINITEDSTRKYSHSIFNIRNVVFLDKEKNKINNKINPNAISLVFYEIMKEISKYFNIDYIIQVSFDNKNRQIPSLENIKIFERDKFIDFDLKSEGEFKTVKNYLLYEKDFSFKENFFEKEDPKETSHLDLRKNENEEEEEEEEGEEEEEEEEKKKRKKKENSNPKIMNLNNNSTTEKEEKSKIEEENNLTKNLIKKKKKEKENQNYNSQKSIPDRLITNLSLFEKIPLSPTGIINPSIYCFMNTCLQCLSSIPELNSYFYNKKYEKEKKSKKKLKACESYNEFLLLYKEKKIIKPPKSIYSTCHSFLESGRQHDCQEFLRRFLGRIQDELNYDKKYRFPDNINMEDAWNIYRNVNPSFVDSVFTGLITSTVKCLKCKFCSYTYDPFLDLSVSIENKKNDNLKDCLDRYFSSEKLDCGYKCEKCKKKTKVIIFLILLDFEKIRISFSSSYFNNSI